jgi:hypothetical protein
MGLLEGLLGGQATGVEDFARRYEQEGGESLADAEAAQHHRTVAEQLSPDEYESAAEDAISRLSPEQRREFVEHIRGEATRQDINFPGLHDDPNLHQPSSMASLFGRMQQQQPGMLHQLLGGGDAESGGAFKSPVAKLAMAGIAAYGLKRLMSRR